MRCAFAGLAVLAVLCPAVTPARADIHVTISKSQQQMAVSIDGGPSYRWTVSTGRPGYTTPSGSFRAIRLEQVYYSKKYDNAPMPHAVFFYGGYAIHGTLEERHLGRAVSHGCVRLTREHAAILFDEVRRQGMNRTHIVITDAPLYGAAPVARAIDDPRYAPQPRYREAGRAMPQYDTGYAPPREVVTFDPRYRDDRGYTTFETPRREVVGPEQVPRDGRRVTVERDPSYIDLSRSNSRHLTRRERRALERAAQAERRDAHSRRAMRLEPGHAYTEAELRRFYRQNGLDW